MDGQPQRDPNAVTDSVMPALLGPGGFPTTPQPALGQAGQQGNQAEARRMFDNLVIPFQVDPTLVNTCISDIYKNAAATQVSLSSPISDAVGAHEFVVGINSCADSSNGENTNSTRRPVRAASTWKVLPCIETVAVLVTVRYSDHKNASVRSSTAGKAGARPARSHPSAQRASGDCPVSECSRR